jgi:CubicO group peptidase (beta-lactamase class C family)
MKMKTQVGKNYLTLLLLLIFLTNISYSSSFIAQSNRTHKDPDYWPTDNWRTSSPEEQGVSSIKLQEMYEYFNSTWELEIVQASMGSLLIVRNGYLIHENYFSSYLHETRGLNIYSCTKSVTSTLIGIGIDEGYIVDVDDPLLSYFPNRTVQNRDIWKEAITIEDLLTMRAGFTWDESNYENPSNDYTQMYAAPNAVQYVLDRPMMASPGTSWLYNTGNSHLLSAILDTITPNGTREFAQSRLFDPLGIDPSEWSLDAQRIPYGGSNLRLKPREMAKFGFLILNNGTWEGQQIVSKEWVAAATQSSDTTSFYGYQWWIEPVRNTFSARGYKGQHIVIVPDHDMVIVFSANSFAAWDLYPTLIEEYIIPAVGYVPPTTTTTTVAQNTSFLIFPIILALGTLVARRRKKRN